MAAFSVLMAVVLVHETLSIIIPQECFDQVENCDTRDLACCEGPCCALLTLHQFQMPLNKPPIATNDMSMKPSNTKPNIIKKSICTPHSKLGCFKDIDCCNPTDQCIAGMCVQSSSNANPNDIPLTDRDTTTNLLESDNLKRYKSYPSIPSNINAAAKFDKTVNDINNIDQEEISKDPKVPIFARTVVFLCVILLAVPCLCIWYHVKCVWFNIGVLFKDIEACFRSLALLSDDEESSEDDGDGDNEIPQHFRRLKISVNSRSYRQRKEQQSLNNDKVQKVDEYATEDEEIDYDI